MTVVKRWVNLSKRKFEFLLIFWFILFIFIGYIPIVSGSTIKEVLLNKRTNGTNINFMINILYFVFDKWIPFMIISAAIILFEISFTRIILEKTDDPTFSKKEMTFFAFVRILTFAPISGIVMLLNADEAPDLLKNFSKNLENNSPENYITNNIESTQAQNVNYNAVTSKFVNSVRTNNNASLQSYSQEVRRNVPQSNKPRYINGLKPFSKKNIGGFFIGEAVIIAISLFFTPVIKNITLAEDLRKKIAGIVVIFLILSVMCYVFNCGLSHKRRVFKKCQKLKKGTSIEEVKYLLQNMPLYKEGISPLGYYVISYKTKQITKSSDFEGITFIFDNNGLQYTEISYRRTQYN